MIKKIPIFLTLYYITFYIPFVLTAYNTSWYKLNCNFHDRCDTIGVSVAHEGMEELTGFLFHMNDLVNRWTAKEILHLNEVRTIMDIMFLIALLAGLYLVLFSNKKEISGCSIVNIFIIAGLFVIIPFFSIFWRDIFHDLMFDNNHWLNTPVDLSYYLMPRKFFKITVAAILSCWLVINFLIYRSTRTSGV